MRLMKIIIFVFVLSCIVLTMPLYGIEITPSNVTLPTSPGGLFSFDYIISDAMSTSAYAFQSNVSVSGPGTLTFDDVNSVAVNTELDYWLLGDSGGAGAIAELDKILEELKKDSVSKKSIDQE